MPPPRPLLLSRPCHPIWVTAQVRWMSGRPNGSPPGGPGKPQDSDTGAGKSKGKVFNRKNNRPVKRESSPTIRPVRTQNGLGFISIYPGKNTSQSSEKGKTELVYRNTATGSEVESSLDGGALEGRLAGGTTTGLHATDKRLNDPFQSGKENQESEAYPNRTVKKDSAQELEASTKPRRKPQFEKSQLSSEQQSLLEELFPEFKKPPTTNPSPTKPTSQTSPQRPIKDYPRLKLPTPILFPKPPLHKPTKPPTETSLRRTAHLTTLNTETITVLKLSNVSTELTASDFRRLIPRGKHIENWARDGEFYKIIPARNPISLERLPVYYLLFTSPSAALAYQTNASRLHKLAGLYSPTDIFSAIQPPKGFLEDGEDISSLVNRYTLAPPNLKLRLRMEMQPYAPGFRALLERGGYKGVILPDREDTPKVLLHIEGYEPETQELHDLLYRDGYERGFQWPIRDGAAGILKLRDVINYKPRRSWDASMEGLNEGFETPATLDGEITGRSDDGALKQHILTKMYNRWIIQFEDVDMARRFANTYHRRLLPKPHHLNWRVFEVERWCNTELLW